MRALLAVLAAIAVAFAVLLRFGPSDPAPKRRRSTRIMFDGAPYWGDEAFVSGRPPQPPAAGAAAIAVPGGPRRGPLAESARGMTDEAIAKGIEATYGRSPFSQPLAEGGISELSGGGTVNLVISSPFGYPHGPIDPLLLRERARLAASVIDTRPGRIAHLPAV
jgi:hypothetical protein